MGTPIKPYAKRLIRTMRSDVHEGKAGDLPPVDTAEVVKVRGGVQLRPVHGRATYDEDDIIWNVDPESVKVGDHVTIGRDPADNPIVFGLVDAMQPDPSLHPTHKKLQKDFDKLKGRVQTWKGTSKTVALLPVKGNKAGDVRLVTDTGILYRWRGTAWVTVGTKTARVYRSTVQSIPTATPTPISFSNEVADTSSIWSIGVPTRLIAPIDGMYLITGGMMWAGGLGGTHRSSYIMVNGVDVVAANTLAPNASTYHTRSNLSVLVDLSAGDYVELVVEQDSGGPFSTALDGKSSMYFAMALDCAL